MDTLGPAESDPIGEVPSFLYSSRPPTTCLPSLEMTYVANFGSWKTKQWPITLSLWKNVLF